MYDPLLITWASQYHGFSIGITARSAVLSQAVLPPQATQTDRALVGRWFTWTLMLEDYMLHDMQQPGEQATAFWRGLRAVGERRAAPTSPFGLALNDIIANLVRLRGVTPADVTLLSVAVGTLLDGLATRYTWQRSKMTPDRESERVARARSSGIGGIYALLSAIYDWGLAELMLSHPIRRMITHVELVAALLTEPGSAADRAERTEATLASIRLTLRSLPPRWDDLGIWTFHLLAGVAQWAAAEQAD
jgi:hypothetical protein